MAIATRVFAFIAACSLSGCLVANTSLIPNELSLKPFGDSASYTYLAAEPASGETKALTYKGTIAWDGEGYTLTPEGSSGALVSYVKLAELDGDLLIAEERASDSFEAYKPSYALAKLTGKTVSVYNADCGKLSDAERRELGLTEVSEGCRIDSLAQLKATLKKIAAGELSLLRTYTIS